MLARFGRHTEDAHWVVHVPEVRFLHWPQQQNHTNMNITKPKLNLTARYTAVETCRLLGICRETLRRHTRRGNIVVHYRKANMRPFYIGSDIMAFWNRYI